MIIVYKTDNRSTMIKPEPGRHEGEPSRANNMYTDIYIKTEIDNLIANLYLSDYCNKTEIDDVASRSRGATKARLGNMYIYIYIHAYMYKCMYIYIYICT